MHDHDFDLIAAFADGTASSQEMEAAELAVQACRECSAEFEAQISALELLRSEPPAAMTDFERAELHRSLNRAVAPPRREVGWFSRYAPRVAAVAAGFAVVGLVSVAMLGQLGNGDDAEVTDAAAEMADEDQEAGSLLQAPPAAPTEETTAQRQAAAAADDSALPEDGGSDDAPETSMGAAIEPPIEISVDDLENWAGLLIPDSLRLLFDSTAEPPSTTCLEQLPEYSEIEFAIDVIFEGEAAHAVVYTVDGTTVATAFSQPDCVLLAEVTGP